jgi:hypothetical protein
MPFEIAVPTNTSAPLPIQYISAEITPLIGGQFSVVMQATLLDEEELQFIGQDLANARVDTLDEALAVIRENVAALDPLPLRAVA